MSVAPVGPQRLQWVDAARGGSVSLVVLMHFVFWLNAPLARGEPAVSHWQFVTGALAPFRMSLLFALAGMLTSRYVLQGWSSPKTRRRAADGLYLYLIWTTLYILLSLLPLPGVGVPFRHSNVLLEYVAPTSPLWFIASLALWTVVVAVVAPRLPAAVVLGALASLTLVVAWVWPALVPLRILYYGFFFALGVYGTDRLRRFGENPKAWIALASALLVVGAQGLQMLWPALEPPARLVAGIAGIFFAIYAVRIVCRINVIGSALAWVGQRTLTIYVLHLPILVLLSALAVYLGVGHNPGLILVGPVIGTILIVWLCARAHEWLTASPLRFLLVPPRKSPAKREQISPVVEPN